MPELSLIFSFRLISVFSETVPGCWSVKTIKKSIYKRKPEKREKEKVPLL